MENSNGKTPHIVAELPVLAENTGEQLNLLRIDRGDEKAKIGTLWNPILPAGKERRSPADPVEDVSMYDAAKFQKLTFAEAEPVFLAYKRTRVKAATIICYEMYLRHLRVYFAAKRLFEISIGDIKEYQALRVAGKIQPPPLTETKPNKRGRIPTHRAGVSLINHELNALTQILHKAGLWENRLDQWYTPLEQRDPDPPKVMTQQEEDRFFLTAASNPDWSVAYWVASLTNQTSASGIEIRNLRLKDVDLQQTPPQFIVPEGKNKHRKGRPIALNDTAYKQMCRIIQRAIAMGACHPDHYLFPFGAREKSGDVTRPASKSWLKKQWAALVAAAGVPWLKPHNLRFQCATRLRAAGVAAETIKLQFGWRNLKMLEHYNRPQMDVLYQAVQAIDPGKRKAPEKTELVPAWMPKSGFPQKSGQV